MLVWMSYAAILGLLLTGATRLLEALPVVRRSARRWLWLLSLVAVVVAPLVLPLVAPPVVPDGIEIGTPVPGTPPVADPARTPPEAAPAPLLALHRLDPILATGWLLASLALLGGLGVSAVALTRRMRRWPRVWVDGVAVRVGTVAGPAVVGVRRPEIVVPPWALELPAADRRLVLAHERAHLEARDPLLMFAAWCLAASVPWNPATWIALRRLRAAMEEDCDRRVIRDRDWAESRRYGELLVDLGARLGRPSALAAPTGFAESGSPLERRIRSMYDLYPPLSRIRKLFAGAGVVGLVAAAFLFPRPEAAILTDAADETPAAEADVPDQADRPEPRFTPFTSAPVLINRDEVGAALLRNYPPLLRDAGIGGTALVWLFVSEEGEPRDVRIDEPSGHSAIDAAAIEVARIMRFRPALDGETPVSVWIRLPVTFAVPGAPQQPEAEPERADEAAGEGDGPRFTPYTVAPDLVNRAEVTAALQAEYPPLLRDAGIGGTARIWFFIDTEGRVSDTRVQESSGHEAIDDAALRVAHRMRFTPALNRDEPTAVWVAFPITFQVR